MEPSDYTIDDVREQAEIYFAGDCDLEVFAHTILDGVAATRAEFDRIAHLALTDITHHAGDCDLRFVAYRPQHVRIEEDRIATWYRCDQCRGSGTVTWSPSMLPPRTRRYWYGDTGDDKPDPT